MHTGMPVEDVSPGPILLFAFSGWNDACDAASDAIGHLVDAYDAQPVAEIRPGNYYDLQRYRPLVSIGVNGRRDVAWPVTEVLVARVPGRDLILVRGPEPGFRWDEFCDELLAIIGPVQPSLALALGSVAAEVPHTRDLPIKAFTQDADLAASHGVGVTAHEGFTGITGILADACDAAGIPTIRVWVSVPSYVSTPPSPKATLALITSVSALAGLSIDQGDLDERSEAWTRSIDELASLHGLGERIARMESDAQAGGMSGDAVEDELLRFLRDRTS